MGSMDGGEFALPVSSVRPSRSAVSAEADADLLAPGPLPTLSCGRNFGERLGSSVLIVESFEILKRDRPGLGSAISSSICPSDGAGVTASMKGTSNESFMSSYIILTDSFSCEGLGGLGPQDSSNRLSRTGAGRLTSRGAYGMM
jgi:hypothetical protein